MMRQRLVLLAMWLIVLPAILRGAAWKGDFPATRKVPLLLQAGAHPSGETPISVLIDAGKAQSVFVAYADGTLGRAQLVEPGLLNASAREQGKKELHFLSPAMARGTTTTVTALLSDKAVQGRTYVWSGESRENRRLSCAPCHQGPTMPSGGELRCEWQVLEKTGHFPPLEASQVLPTSKNEDYRWHKKLRQNFSSACWECHARHMVQYEFGQSLQDDLVWAPDPPHAGGTAKRPARQSVYHTVFRVRRDRTLSHPLAEKQSRDRAADWRLSYGFPAAVVDAGPCSELVQEHAATLSEEAGKFIGRHNVLIDWAGRLGNARRVVAREERQVTVKDLRGRNGSYALWIDVVSLLSATGGSVRLDGSSAAGGLRFAPSMDAGTVSERRTTAAWNASTFISEGTTYTAVCFNHPNNPQPLVDQSPGRDGFVGYRFSATAGEKRPLLVHYRLWIQGGQMPVEEIESMAADFLAPVGTATPRVTARP